MWDQVQGKYTSSNKCNLISSTNDTISWFLKIGEIRAKTILQVDIQSCYTNIKKVLILEVIQYLE